MESHPRVEITPRMVPVSAREASQAAVELGQALQDLNAAKAAGGETDIKRADDAYRAAYDAYKVETKPDGWTARIGDTAFPILAYAVDLDDSGAPALSLVLQPDSLSIGEPPVPAPPARPSPEAKVSSWGDGSQPDPRESIPGWQPEKLGEQVASHAERVALRTWEPSAGQEKASAFKRLIRLAGEAGSVTVTA